jgi:hypothetical protein
MSCDFGIWWPSNRLDAGAAGRLYAALCEGDTTGVAPSPAIDAFYNALTRIHPEIDDVAEEDLDNADLCPWSIAFDRSPGHLIICCVWSKAQYVQELIHRLASEHGLAVFDPQSETVTYPSPEGARSMPTALTRRPWWRFW